MLISLTRAKVFKQFGFILLLTFPIPIIAQVNPAAPESIDEKKIKVSTASGQSVVVTANPLASEAALETLKKGGTAMDAVVAAQTVLAVVEPQSSGLGGGSFLMYWDESTRSLLSSPSTSNSSWRSSNFKMSMLDAATREKDWIVSRGCLIK